MLEQKLIAIDAAADQAAKYHREIGTIIKALRKASDTGDLGQVNRSVAELTERLSCLSKICNDVSREAAFDDAEYFGSEAFLEELSKAADAAGVRTIKGIDCLFSYPVSLKVDPHKKCLLIGKRRDSRLRPRFVAQELKRLQNDAGRISEAAFLE